MLQHLCTTPMVCCNACHRVPLISYKLIIMGSSRHASDLKLSATSWMYLDPVPKCLKDLSYIIQMMIAQIHPVILIIYKWWPQIHPLYRIRGSQYGYSKNVISYKQNIESFISRLPVNPGDMTLTVLVTRNTLSGCYWIFCSLTTHSRSTQMA